MYIFPLRHLNYGILSFPAFPVSRGESNLDRILAHFGETCVHCKCPNMQSDGEVFDES